jgi:hypothetical protein
MLKRASGKSPIIGDFHPTSHPELNCLGFEAGLKPLVAGQFICVQNRRMKGNYLSFIQLPKNT